MKLSERLQFYRDEVKRSKKWRKDEGYDSDWRRFIDLYRGKQYQTDVPGDKLIVNLMFSTVNTMAPAVAVNNPKFVVNARKPDKAAQAVVTEEILNYLWRQWRLPGRVPPCCQRQPDPGPRLVQGRLQVHQAARREEGRRHRSRTRSRPMATSASTTVTTSRATSNRRCTSTTTAPSSNGSARSTCSSTPMPATPKRCAGSPSASGARWPTSNVD